MPSTMSIRVVLLAAVAACAVLLLSLLQPPVAAAASCPGATKSNLPLRTSERVVFCMVNRERAKRGLRRLSSNRILKRVARRHSADQVRGYAQKQRQPCEEAQFRARQPTRFS